MGDHLGTPEAALVVFDEDGGETAWELLGSIIDVNLWEANSVKSMPH